MVPISTRSGKNTSAANRNAENFWKKVEKSPIYKDYDAVKKNEREVELAVLDAIRREHDLPLTERRWNDGMLIVYDEISVHACDPSPIGWCVTYTPEDGQLGIDRPCLFCGEMR